MWVLVVLGLVVIAFGVVYNSLVKLGEQAEAAWADIDVQLRRRHDLVPNLVETVKGYASHERGVLEAVTQARTSAMGAQGPADKARAEGTLSDTLKSLFALAEAYPSLQAAGGFRDLHASLSQLEEAIQQARRYYNAVVRDFNTRIQQIPGNLVAAMFNFRRKEFFEIPEAEAEVPKVDFGQS